MRGSKVECYSLDRDGNLALSRHFKVREFRCKDGSDPIFISPDLVDALEAVRLWAKAPVVITSAFRTAQHNARSGGAKYSQHLYGLAADITVKGKTPMEVARFLETVLPRSGGIGLYQSFVHVDVRGKRYRWDQRSGKEISVSGF